MTETRGDSASKVSNDMFDIMDEDHDELKYSTKELDRYFEQGHLHSMMEEEEEEMIDDDSYDVQVRISMREIDMGTTVPCLFPL